jgi:hypothetical protein
MTKPYKNSSKKHSDGLIITILGVIAAIFIIINWGVAILGVILDMLGVNW